MRRVIANTFLTLDGVMQAPGAPEEDPRGGFTAGGWSVPYWDDLMGRVMDEATSAPFDLLLGRRTYEIFAAHWPSVTDDVMADRLNAATKHVASTTRTPLDWGPAQLLSGDVPAAVAALKAGDGPDLQVHGSATLLQALIASGLVDVFRVWTFPVVVGRGLRLFGDGAVPAALRLVDATVSTTGVVIATYEPAGPLQPGSFALEEPTEAELHRRAQLAGG